MKRVLFIILTLVMVGSASAQLQNAFCIFWEEGEYDSYHWDDHNLNTVPGVAFEIYIVLLNPSLNYLAGYECSIEFNGGYVFTLGLGGPDAYWADGAYHWPDGFSYGGTNFGDDNNQLVGYTYPVPTYGDHVLLARMMLLQSDAEMVQLYLGPSEPSSVDGPWPAVVNGLDLDEIVACTYASGPDLGGYIGTFNGPTVATEQHTWSGVKAMFD